jgi:HD-GYP domain-containing protein (c-di-GMP phosphodiesterase class II)
VYRRGRSYEAAAEELDKWAGRQFDPQVVAAFHRVPREDWEELCRLSLMRKEERVLTQPPFIGLLEAEPVAFVS